jgi:hypothetical protein
MDTWDLNLGMLGTKMNSILLKRSPKTEVWYGEKHFNDTPEYGGSYCFELSRQEGYYKMYIQTWMS